MIRVYTPFQLRSLAHTLTQLDFDASITIRNVSRYNIRVSNRTEIVVVETTGDDHIYRLVKDES